MDLLDLYLDGLLDDSSRRTVQDAIARDHALRCEVSLQDELDHALTRLFAPPAAKSEPFEITAGGISEPAPVHSFPERRSRIRALSMAACLALGVLGVWRLWTFFVPPPASSRYAPQSYRTFDQVYGDEIKGGYAPEWICRNDEELSKFVREKLGRPLLLAQVPPGIETLGWSHCFSVSPTTIHLLAKVHGVKVLVFVDRLKNEKDPIPAPKPGFRAFRHTLGPFVMYEYTPLDHPQLLSHFFEPKTPGT